MSDEISFEHKGNIEIPEKGDVATEKIIQEVNAKIKKEQIEGEIRKDTPGAEPEKKGSLTKDVPQAVFRLVARVIECEKFKLDDDEAATFAANLNILIPIEGKIAAFLIILLIVLNKVYICMDAIKAKFGHKKPEFDELSKPSKEKLPEVIR